MKRTGSRQRRKDRRTKEKRIGTLTTPLEDMPKLNDWYKARHPIPSEWQVGPWLVEPRSGAEVGLKLVVVGVDKKKKTVTVRAK